MMRRTILAALLVALAAPQAASAGFFPAEAVEGPGSDVQRVGGIDLSRDGSGGVVYVRTADGADHVYLSRLADGAFGTPERIDNGQAGASSQPVIGVADGGRMAIAWVNGGSLFVATKAKDSPTFTGPALVADGGVSNPSIDMSINGSTYLSYTQNGDVRVLRAARDTNNWQGLPAPVDVDQARTAGTGQRLRSRVSVSADGTGLVVWGEQGGDGRTHVYARRLFELRLSTAPQDLTLNELAGAAARDADTPEVDMEDDSSYAQVVFRQVTTQGERVVMRRLVGSTFDGPIPVDNGSYATRGRIDITGRGEGLFGISATGGPVLAGSLFNNQIRQQYRFDSGNSIEPWTTSAIGENEDGAITWMQGAGASDATVRARYFDGVEQTKLEGESILSRPEWGPVDPDRGLDAAASRAGDVAIVFTQSSGEGRRLVAAFYDKPPTRIAGSNSQAIRRLNRLSWGTSLNLLGPVTYTVFVDNRQVAQTTDTRWTPPPGSIPDGNHTWFITMSDRRGQTQRSRTRRLRVDNTAPLVSVSLRKRGRVLTVSARPRDSRGRLKSGVSRVLVDWGNRRLVRIGKRASKRFGRKGRYSVRVRAIDKAGNATTVTRRVQIG
jgi:hypothetical protein